MFLYSTVSTLKPAAQARAAALFDCQHARHWTAGGRPQRADQAAQSIYASGRHATAAGERPSPMVGMVVTISPSFSLYRMVVLPAASKPTCEAGEAAPSAPRRPAFDSSAQCPLAGAARTHHQNAHLLLGEELQQGRGGTWGASACERAACGGLISGPQSPLRSPARTAW